MKIFLGFAAVLAITWSAEAGTLSGGPAEYRLYDCGGDLKPVCLAQFPGTAAPYDAEFPYRQGDRLVIKGVDLSPVYDQGRETWVLYYRHPYAVGYICDQECDGHPIKWNIETGERIDSRAGGMINVPTDINSSGIYVGITGGSGSYYDGHPLGDFLGVIEDWEHNAYIFESLHDVGTTLYRINERGQALGEIDMLLGLQFVNGEPDWENSNWYKERRLFMFAPVGAPIPEPATFLLAGFALLAGWRCRRRSSPPPPQ